MTQLTKYIKKHYRRGDSARIGERLGMNQRRVWNMLTGYNKMQPEVASAFIELVKERKQTEEKIMEEISAL